MVNNQPSEKLENSIYFDIWRLVKIQQLTQRQNNHHTRIQLRKTMCTNNKSNNKWHLFHRSCTEKERAERAKRAEKFRRTPQKISHTKIQQNESEHKPHKSYVSKISKKLKYRRAMREEKKNMYRE